MARSKALSAADERILNMALLMGLTGRDLVRIGGLVERHRKLRERATAIEEYCLGWTFVEESRGSWTLTNPGGQVYQLREVRQRRLREYRVTRLDSQGRPEAFHEFAASKWWQEEFPNRIYPCHSKVLFRALQQIREHGLFWTPVKKRGAKT